MNHFLWLDNQRSAQSRFVPDRFSKILDRFETVIEIGTFTGVFTRWLSENVSEGCKIITYDVKPNYREVGEIPGVNFRIGDVFDPSIISEIKTLIEFGGRTLVLCDGGDKETEFKLFSRFLKHNDVIMLHDYEETPNEYSEISREIGWTTVSESHLINIRRYLDDLQLQMFYYEDFKKVLWGSFIKKSRRKITLTITSSKRLNLFQRTIESFSAKCCDVSCISKVFHFDDSSSYDDRKIMESKLAISFPNSEVCSKYFEEGELGVKRHCEIINIMLETISKESDFNFHLEDDWFFEKNFSLIDCINFLEKDPEVAYVGVSQPLRKFPDEIHPTIRDGFWKWYYDPNQANLSNLFLDTKIMEIRNQEGFWCYFINWPYFGFRPGVWDLEKISSEKRTTCESGSPFELLFASQLAKKYVSYHTIESVCTHIGEEISSYEINKSER